MERIKKYRVIVDPRDLQTHPFKDTSPVYAAIHAWCAMQNEAYNRFLGYDDHLSSAIAELHPTMIGVRLEIFYSAAMAILIGFDERCLDITDCLLITDCEYFSYGSKLTILIRGYGGQHNGRNRTMAPSQPRHHAVQRFTI